MNCDQIRELLEAYALGALDAKEQASVEEHLAGCADCRRLANEYADVTNRLPQALAATSPLRPPPSLKSHVLQSLEAAPTAPSHARSLSPDGKPGRTQRGAPAWRWLSSRRWPVLAALAAIILLILSIAWSVQLSVALAQERTLRTELESALANLAEQRELVLEVIDSNKTVKAPLRPTQSDSPSYGKLWTCSDLRDVVAMAGRLPQPLIGQAYHLWVTINGQTQLAGILDVNSNGFGLLVFEADRNGPVYESAQLTLQPEGSITPSAPPILFWQAPP